MLYGIPKLLIKKRALFINFKNPTQVSSTFLVDIFLFFLHATKRGEEVSCNCTTMIDEVLQAIQ
ncbi:hypothetical protein AT395_07805 [Pandoraea apista]|nr:hypothetical protein AT395_07805 [Pandoraea apista]